MRRIVSILAALLVIAGLAGCTGQPGKQLTTQEVAAYHRRHFDAATKEASELIAKGDFDRASSRVEFYLTSEDEGVRADAAKFLRANPRLLDAQREAIKGQAAKSTSPDELAALLKRAETLERWQVFQASDAQDMKGAVRAAILSANETSRAAFTLEHASILPEFQGPPHVRLLFARSLDAAIGPKADRKAVSDLLRFAKAQGPTSDYSRAVRAALPLMPVSMSELRGAVAEVFPDYAQRDIAVRTLAVSLTTEPARRLVEEDVLAKLKGRSESVVWSRGQGSQGLEVVIKELQFDERRQPPQTQTLTVGYYEVDPFTAVLSLPRNASVLLDVTQGSSEIEYAYEIVARQGGRVVAEKLIRDKTTDRYRSCSNMRAQNVFGGVQPFNVWPNERVRQHCQSGGDAVSPSALRARVIDVIANEVMRLPPIASGVARESGGVAGTTGLTSSIEAEPVMCRITGAPAVQVARRTCKLVGGRES